MFKNSLFLGVSAGLFSGLASYIYAQVYTKTQYVDFSSVAGTISIFSACMFGCVLASIGYWASVKLMKNAGEIIFNFLFTLISFASILGPIAATLPLDQEFPEMFPGFAIPMHFFPALIWYTLKPVFFRSARS